VSKAAHIFLSAFLVAPLASAEQIFKCVGKSGSDLYQNFPCEFRSMPMSTQRADASSARDSSSAQPRRSPAIGMTHDEVAALWGQAPNAYYSEIVDGRVEIWAYSDSRSVTFDAAGRVSAVQR